MLTQTKTPAKQDAHDLKPFYSSATRACDKPRENQRMCETFQHSASGTGREVSTVVCVDISQRPEATSSSIFHVDSDGDESTVKSHVTRLFSWGTFRQVQMDNVYCRW